MRTQLRRSKEVVITCLAALGFVLGGWVAAGLALRGVGDAPLILHFDDLQGVTAVGGWQGLAAIGALGIIVVALNLAIALELDARDRFLGKFVAALTLFFAVLLFMGFLAIMNVN